MAIRNIIKIGDESLTKKCRTVDRIDQRIITLLDDMAETLYNSEGIGLAAPQVGVLKRIAVIDAGDGLLELINPEITGASDDMIEDCEGCLSVPGKWGIVKRPRSVTVRATDRHGNKTEITAEELLARAICHELDHLDGHLFIEKVTEFIDPEELEERKSQRQ
ncbi:MAG: Peptide deformylase [Firmicutes bacterium ADurb.Bin193]|nr:MAG: Peptide deformylase [Firmicutes bacterium ADurb.Bin193]